MDNQNDGMLFEERRSFRRIPVNKDVRFFNTNMFYAGKISNLSETGMFIHTRKCFPIGAMLVVIVRNRSELARVLVKIKRTERLHEFCDGIAVELASPSKIYSSLVKDLKTTD